MSDTSTTIAELRQAVRDFVAERQWERFHAPKNLAMALAAEAAELMEHFLWIDAPASREIIHDPDKLRAVGEEIADVACLVFNLCNVLELDLSATIKAKMIKNVQKYPSDRYRGRYE